MAFSQCHNFTYIAILNSRMKAKRTHEMVREEGIFGLERITPETYSSGLGPQNYTRAVSFWLFGPIYYVRIVKLFVSR